MLWDGGTGRGLERDETAEQEEKKERKKKKRIEKRMGRVLLKVWPVDQEHLHHVGTWKFKFSAPTLDPLNQSL